MYLPQVLLSVLWWENRPDHGHGITTGSDPQGVILKQLAYLSKSRRDIQVAPLRNLSNFSRVDIFMDAVSKGETARG